MPWTAADADRHKKGLSPKQKRQWAHIANSALRSCQKRGGSNCEGEAIRKANGSFSEDGKMTEKMKQGALYLADEGKATAFAVNDGEKKQLNMLAYSGGVIKGHWYWGDLAMDCQGVKVAKTFPILESHDVSRKIGFSSSPIVGDDGIRLDPSKTKFVSTEFSEEFQKVSSEGFPFQSSVRARPLVIERLAEDEKTEVNGYTFKGPGTVFRKWEMTEASVCVFGWDNRTSAKVFSEDVTLEFEVQGNKINLDSEKEITLQEGGEKMDFKELSEKHPELVKEIQAKAKEEAQKEFSQRESALTGQITSLEQSNKELKTTVLSLEKKDALRTEKELAFQASQIFSKKLTESSVPERLHEKVKRHVDHNQFVKDDILDVAAFSKAIDDEIKDWESRGATTQVMGQSFTREEEETGGAVDVELQKENEATVKRLLSSAGGLKKDS